MITKIRNDVLTLSVSFCLVLEISGCIQQPTIATNQQFNSTAIIDLVKQQLAAEQPAIRQSQTQLFTDVEILASDKMNGRKYGSVGSKLAQDYIISRFRATGLVNQDGNFSADGYRQHFTEGRSGTNLVAFSSGNSILTAKDRCEPDSWYVITAHYDHLGANGRDIFNGADDNASGVAAMLYFASRLQQRPNKETANFIFVATDAEEAGLYGSKAFIRHPPLPLKCMALNINIDMVGRKGRGQRLYLAISKEQSKTRALVKAILPQLSQLWPAQKLVLGHNNRGGVATGSSSLERIDWQRASDHDSFRRQKIPYLFFSDSPHRDYHKPTDESERIDREYFSDNAELIFQLMLILTETDSIAIKH